MLRVRNACSHAYNFMASRRENISAAHKVHHCLQEYTSKAKTDDSSDWQVVFHSHDVHTQNFHEEISSGSALSTGLIHRHDGTQAKLSLQCKGNTVQHVCVM